MNVYCHIQCIDCTHTRLPCKHMRIVHNHTLSRSFLAHLNAWPLRNLMLSQCAKQERLFEVRQYSLAYWLVFHAITFEHSGFTKITIFKNQASVALNPFVSLFGRLVARSTRISAGSHTHTHTHTQTKYHNPHCTCALKINYMLQKKTEYTQTYSALLLTYSEAVIMVRLCWV